MSNRSIYIVLFSLLGVAYLGGLFIQVMEVDAAQYAAMSMEMLQTHHFLRLYDGGTPYLDKPPLLMWLSSLSFYLFGVSEFAYRLPSFLATILAIYSTYRLAKQWYNPKVAKWGALILASCQAFFLFNNDVKTDNLLTGMVVFAIWQLSSYTINGKFTHLVFGFIGIGFAMLAKGPIGLLIPAVAIGSHLLLQRKLKKVFSPAWLIGIPLVLLILSPMLVGLYEQWGWHGIKFYFWTQSFGRITGASAWNNDSGYFFFLHTFAWAFLPWTICSLFAIFYGVKELVVSRFKLNEGQEGITLAGFVLMFAALSLSHYKLPHYIFVLFPFAAVFTARQVFQISANLPKTYRWLSKMQTVVYMLMGLAIIVLLWLVFKPVWITVFTLSLLGSLVAAAISIRGTNAFRKVILPGVICMAAINFGLNYGFYPRLLQYQPSNAIGKFVAGRLSQAEIPANKFYCLNSGDSHSLNFYAGRIVKPIYSDFLKDTLAKRDIWLYADEDDFQKFAAYKRFPGAKDTMFAKFPVQNMSLDFLNPSKRPETLRYTLLVHLSKIGGQPNTTNK